MRQIYSLIFRSTDLQIGQTERANLLNKSINGRRRHMPADINAAMEFATMTKVTGTVTKGRSMGSLFIKAWSTVK